MQAVCSRKKPAPPVKPYGGLFITEDWLKMKTCIRIWTAPLFFKKAVIKLPEVIMQALRPMDTRHRILAY